MWSHCNSNIKISEFHPTMIFWSTMILAPAPAWPSNSMLDLHAISSPSSSFTRYPFYIHILKTHQKLKKVSRTKCSLIPNFQASQLPFSLKGSHLPLHLKVSTWAQCISNKTTSPPSQGTSASYYQIWKPHSPLSRDLSISFSNMKTTSPPSQGTSASPPSLLSPTTSPPLPISTEKPIGGELFSCFFDWKYEGIWFSEWVVFIWCSTL